MKDGRSQHVGIIPDPLNLWTILLPKFRLHILSFTYDLASMELYFTYQSVTVYKISLLSIIFYTFIKTVAVC